VRHVLIPGLTAPIKKGSGDTRVNVAWILQMWQLVLFFTSIIIVEVLRLASAAGATAGFRWTGHCRFWVLIVWSFRNFFMIVGSAGISSYAVDGGDILSHLTQQVFQRNTFQLRDFVSSQGNLAAM